MLHIGVIGRCLLQVVLVADIGDPVQALNLRQNV